MHGDQQNGNRDCIGNGDAEDVQQRGHNSIGGHVTNGNRNHAGNADDADDPTPVKKVHMDADTTRENYDDEDVTDVD